MGKVFARRARSSRAVAPLSTLAPPVSERRLAGGRMAIVVTIATWAVYVAYTVEQQFIVGKATSARLVIEACTYLVVVTALGASATAYLITRIGYFYRSRAHHRAPRVVLDEFADRDLPAVTVIVPSYQEEERVIRTTLLTAALQEYPGLRVVLLVDDPQSPRTARDRRLLDDARRLPVAITAALAVPAARFRNRWEAFCSGHDGVTPVMGGHLLDLADEYQYAVSWLDALAATHEVVDHSDRFFVDHVVGALSRDLAAVCTGLRDGARAGIALPAARVRQLYARLVSTFGAEVTSFERKRYVSLSHEPNKAMNLNSYIGLLGGAYQEVLTPEGPALVPCEPEVADLVVPHADHVLTLDADSMLLPEYALRMVHLLEQGAHSAIGVVQTPYSAFPGAQTRLERISGATTDLQHLVHQGMTQYGATFWVGANAVLRKRALDDIVEVSYKGDWEIRRYIQDRTVIEDTESTIDLGIHGWQLLNYPERLAYSATPPDFGSLCIQRQRWANGGLLILAKLRRQMKARRERGEQNRFGEIFLRVNYMASIFWSSSCLLVMLAYPFNEGLLSPLLYGVSAPYFVVMASDLRYCGYRRSDILRIYGFNLILLPVNLSGSFASILQLVTGEKSAFKRTPKVRDRTTAPVSFLLLPWVLVGFSAWTVYDDIPRHQWVNLGFAALNATLATYALVMFVGVGNTLADLWAHLRRWLYRPVATPATRARAAATVTDPFTAPVQAVASGRPGVSAPLADLIGPLTSPAGLGLATAMPRLRSSSEVAGRRTAGFAGDVLDLRDGAVPTFFTVLQPILDLDGRTVLGAEAFTRFADGRPVRHHLDAARAEGRGVELDLALVRSAAAAARTLPAGAFLAVNVLDETARRVDDVRAALAAVTGPVLLEVSASWNGAPPPLPPGIELATDAGGTGYEAMARIARLRPAFVKIDRDDFAGLDTDPARRAAVGALLAVAQEHGCVVMAEGVESEAEAQALRRLGIRTAQGFHLAPPAPANLVGAGI